FQLAKILMHINKPEEALIPLQRSIKLDRNYELKAAADGDFKAYEFEVNKLLEGNRIRAKDEAQRLLTALERERARIESQRATEFYFVKNLSLDQFRRTMHQARAAAGYGTFYGYLDSLQFLQKARSQLARELQ